MSGWVHAGDHNGSYNKNQLCFCCTFPVIQTRRVAKKKKGNMSGSGGIHPLSRHSPQIPVLRSGSVNPRDTGSKQTGRKVKVRRRPKLKLTLSWPGGHHNRKTGGGGGSGQGRGRGSRQEVEAPAIDG